MDNISKHSNILLRLRRGSPLANTQTESLTNLCYCAAYYLEPSDSPDKLLGWT
jgi:hypothetical protein